jgi:nucleoid-associated protein YgaU
VDAKHRNREETARGDIMKSIASRLLLVVLIGAFGISAGCAGSGPGRTADIDEGDFYTEEEFKKLSGEQRDAYCAALAEELDESRGAAADASQTAERIQGENEDLEQRLNEVTPTLERLEATNERLESQIRELEALPKTHTVESGEFLYKISGYERIYSDPLKWPRIYRANRDKINDPNLIYPGWVLNIPRDWPSSHTVYPGENLWRISGYWEVYDNSTEWPRIYEANKDQIRDPDIIHPDQVLTIPR